MTEQQHNDTLANAINTGINSQGNASVSLTGSIGDNYFLADLRDDMDFYRFQGGAGDRIEWKITADGFPWYLADLVFGGVLYNANGNRIQNSSQSGSGTYAFILPANGLYYLAVWGGLGRPFSGTFADVNPNLFPRSIDNAVRTGTYTLSLNLFDNTPNYPSPPPATLAIAATNASQTEGNSGSKAFTFTVTRAVNTTGSNNVDWAVTGTGTNPANATDFVGGVFPSGTLSFAAGETSKVITVDVQGDTTVELNENFTVTLSNATNGATITTATATGTIENDDVAVPTLAIAATSANQTEGNSGSKAFTFTVTRSVNTTGTNNVSWAVTGTGTNPANATDFVGGVLPSGTLSFAVGETSQVITVNVQGDTTVELNENFTVTLSNATNGATITTATATGTIENDDISVTPIEAFGNTKLVQDTTNKLYAQIGNNNPIAIKNGATHIATNTYPGWQILAAETVNGINQVLLRNTSQNLLYIWNLDSNWSWQSSQGGWGLNSTQAFSQETNFQQDFNGDGIIGQPSTPIEAFGNTKLVQDTTNKLYAQIGNNNPIAIKNGATHIATNTYPGWQILAAETVNGINQVLLRNTSQNLLYIWNLDSNWNWQSSTGGWGLNSTQAFSQETNFQQDFNGDGFIGQPFTPIEAFGNTKLVQDTTNKLYAQIGNNNPIAIKNGATHIATNTYPGWQILAAETVNGINQVLLRNTSQNLLYIWNLDSNWNWQSSTGGWGLNSTPAFSQETNFQQDFNGDNQIGNPSPSSLVGGLGNDILVGGAGNDTLNGAAGTDTLTGGTGTDIFIFQFSQSTAAALDRVTDFAIGTDKIDLLSQAGAAINAPLAFTRATDSTTTNINTIVTNVFIDANGATAGNQALGINSAVLVRDNSSSTYLIINDGTGGFQSANDLVINLTGLTGSLPALGTIAVNSFFV
ncbi:bluetail domain-containing putative surface protein [Microcystis sp. MC19]|uniref:bluetail domain-containing putative surface protein n=1 Tax=Microcystis sp. MC19 TaxID=1967666 RepID=UPI0020B14396|nr:bluetail domain-containing putative surface protein [Microcystis sp. MC19]